MGVSQSNTSETKEKRGRDETNHATPVVGAWYMTAVFVTLITVMYRKALVELLRGSAGIKTLGDMGVFVTGVYIWFFVFFVSLFCNARIHYGHGFRDDAMNC